MENYLSMPSITPASVNYKSCQIPPLSVQVLLACLIQSWAFQVNFFFLESDLKFPFSRFRDPGLVYLILHSFVSASSVKFSWNVYQEFQQNWVPSLSRRVWSNQHQHTWFLPMFPITEVSIPVGGTYSNILFNVILSESIAQDTGS